MASRLDAKRRTTADHRKKQFATAGYKDLTYPHRLSFYSTPPTADITLEQFEQWAIDRLRVLAEIETCQYRNKSFDETVSYMKAVLAKYLPLSANSAVSATATGAGRGEDDRKVQLERQKDHYSHFILRLAFATTEDLRQRFTRAETTLFRLRLHTDDARERHAFLRSLNLDAAPVADDEKARLLPDLAAVVMPGAAPGAALKLADDETWLKVDWTKVPDLVSARRVLLKKGLAYVPGREHANLVIPEFSARLEKAMELTARALPRLDEDDRLTPILNHLAQNFGTPDVEYGANALVPTQGGIPIAAATIDALSPSFPLCMQSLHRSLRRDAHLKYRGRLQYTLFLKGIGLTLEECLAFWRGAFRKITDDVFDKEYRYNVRHAYGDVGGDGNRRSGGQQPYSCQRILTEHPPGPGEHHGCPYRHFSADNLAALLRDVGVTDPAVLRGVRDDKDKAKFHLACNRVFDHVHARDLKAVRDSGALAAAGIPAAAETIVHPNDYFKRSYVLRTLANSSGGGSGGAAAPEAKGDVAMEG